MDPEVETVGTGSTTSAALAGPVTRDMGTAGASSPGGAGNEGTVCLPMIRVITLTSGATFWIWNTVLPVQKSGCAASAGRAVLKLSLISLAVVEPTVTTTVLRAPVSFSQSSSTEVSAEAVGTNSLRLGVE